jgi:hypothetical protein
MRRIAAPCHQEPAGMLIDALDRLPGRWAARTCAPSIERELARRALRIDTAKAAYRQQHRPLPTKLGTSCHATSPLPSTIGVTAQASAAPTSSSICPGKHLGTRSPAFPFFRTTRWPDLPQARVKLLRLLHSYYRIRRPARPTTAPVSRTHCPRRGHASNVLRSQSTSNP